MAVPFTRIKATLDIHRVAIPRVREFAVDLGMIRRCKLHRARVVDVAEQQVAGAMVNPHWALNKSKLPSHALDSRACSGVRWGQRLDLEIESPRPGPSWLQLDQA